MSIYLQKSPLIQKRTSDLIFIILVSRDSIFTERSSPEVAPARARLHAALGDVLRKRGDPRAAARSYAAALELDPAHAAARRNMRLLQGREPKTEDAAAAFAAALALQRQGEAARAEVMIFRLRSGR